MLTATAVTAQLSTTAVRDRPLLPATKGLLDRTRPPTTTSHPSRSRPKSCLGQSQPFQPWTPSGRKNREHHSSIKTFIIHIWKRRNSVYRRFLWNYIVPMTPMFISATFVPCQCIAHTTAHFFVSPTGSFVGKFCNFKCRWGILAVSYLTTENLKICPR